MVSPTVAPSEAEYKEPDAVENLPDNLSKNWELCGKLGEGAMGAVLKVRNRKTGDYGAAKLIHSCFLDSTLSIQRFIRESKVAQKLSSPYIIAPLEASDDTSNNGNLYIIFEYIAGGTLEELLKKRRFTEDEALDLVEKLAEGLSFAHRQGVIHRDLKPENILMQTEHDPKIADFGLASLSEQAEKLTRTGQMMGTPAYMAPEQLQGNKIDERADLYALALIAFELLAGKRPFETTDLATIIQTRLTGDLPHLRSFAPSVLPPVASLIDKALSKDRENRSESVDRFLKDLRRARNESSILARSSIGATLGPAIEKLRQEKKAQKAAEQQKAGSAHSLNRTEERPKDTIESNSSAVQRTPQVISPNAITEDGSLKKPARSAKRPKNKRVRSERRTKSTSSGSNTAIVDYPAQSRSTKHRTLIGGFLFISIFTVCLLILIFHKGKTNSVTIFKSKPSVQGALSATIKISTPFNSIAYLELESKNKLEKRKIEPKPPTTANGELMKLSKNTLWEMEVNDLVPATTYSYVLYDRDGNSSLQQTFTTRRFTNSLAAEDILGTSVKLSLTPNHTGKVPLTITVFEATDPDFSTKGGVQLPFLSYDYLRAFDKNKKAYFIINGLRPKTSYKVTATIKNNQSSFKEKKPPAIMLKTKGISETSCHTMTKNRMDDDIMGRFVPAIAESWRNQISTHGAKKSVDGVIAYSLDNFGLYLYDLQKRKELKETKTPGKRNISLNISGEILSCIESRFEGNDTEEEKPAGQYPKLQVYEFKTLKLLRSIDLPEGIHRGRLIANRNYGLIWKPTVPDKHTGILSCYSLSSGIKLWDFEKEVSASNHFISSAGELWLQDLQHNLHRCNPKTGKITSSTQLKSQMTMTPVEIAGKLAIMTAGEINFINQSSANIEQTLSVGQDVHGASVNEGKLYCVTSGITPEDIQNNFNRRGRVFCIHLSPEGKFEELFSVTTKFFNAPKGYVAVDNGFLYFADRQDNINCVDLINRNFLYTFGCINNGGFYLFPDETGVYYGQSASIITHIDDRIAPLEKQD